MKKVVCAAFLEGKCENRTCEHAELHFKNGICSLSYCSKIRQGRRLTFPADCRELRGRKERCIYIERKL